MGGTSGAICRRTLFEILLEQVLGGTLCGISLEVLHEQFLGSSTSNFLEVLGEQAIFGGTPQAILWGVLREQFFGGAPGAIFGVLREQVFCLFSESNFIYLFFFGGGGTP